MANLRIWNKFDMYNRTFDTCCHVCFTPVKMCGNQCFMSHVTKCVSVFLSCDQPVTINYSTMFQNSLVVSCAVVCIYAGCIDLAGKSHVCIGLLLFPGLLHGGN